jgi:hypothetical protein
MALTKEEAEKSNLPDLVTRWGERNGAERHRLRTAQSFCLSKIGIEAAGYDFSLNRYKEIEHGYDKLNPGYLYHWLRANGAYLESLGSGATFKEVSKAVVPRIQLPLPSLGQQAVAGAAEGASAEGAARNIGGQDTAATPGGAKPH